MLKIGKDEFVIVSKIVSESLIYLSKDIFDVKYWRNVFESFLRL